MDKNKTDKFILKPAKISLVILIPVFLFSSICWTLESIAWDNLSPSVGINTTELQGIFTGATTVQTSAVNGLEEYSKKVIIPNELGLHARPAAVVATIARQYKGTVIKLQKNDEIVDADDVLDILGLAMHQGEKIKIIASGKEASEAGREIVSFLSNLKFFDGEEHLAWNLTDAPEDITILGNKGLRLAQMVKMGLPIPPGFIVRADRDVSPRVIKAYIITKVKELTKGFPDDIRWVVSVRSSPIKSVPGGMDTILNVGMNAAKARELGEAGKGWKLYSDYLKEFGISVFGIDRKLYESVAIRNYEMLTVKYAEIIKDEFKKRGNPLVEDERIFPMDFTEQLIYTIMAIKESNKNRTVRLFMQGHHDTNEALPTGVIVQLMKFGNKEDSGAFVLDVLEDDKGGTTRIIEYVHGEQGKAIVDGQVTPKPLAESGLGQKQLEIIDDIIEKIKNVFGHNFQLEGTVDAGKVWILQQRNLDKSNAIATVDAGKIDENTLLGKTIFSKEITKKQGQVIRPLSSKDLPEDPQTPYVLVFEYAAGNSTELLLEAVINKRLNITGVVTQMGGRTTHFTRQVELLSKLGYDFTYISDVNVLPLQPGDMVVLNPVKQTVKILNQPAGKSSELVEKQQQISNNLAIINQAI